ncbi:hypothetical protein [Kitasatospora sp. DSM 101779]|uniref:hypothetical protein n=1 Tax=Kitasatospora sp. DSM 101779 TaxID=2853165 RepID=UPI0021D8E92E|nr:hypothetical protein [Kitasatospora sp. DSM 101779]MCU7827028.1 hypothetical protein [Kitasatospora sp. DSM 101779]
MDEGFDARAGRGVSGLDARAERARPEAPACPECGTAVRASGAGRRPVYCSRSCSSKAYRRRRAESHHKVVADALIASRAETPDAADPVARHLLDLAAGVRHAAARYLENLQHSRPGGPDQHGDHALDLLERSVTSTTQELLRTARLLRSRTLADHAPPQRGDGVTAAAQAVADTVPRVGPGPAGDPSDGTAPPGRDQVPPRAGTPSRAPVRVRRPLHHGPVPAAAPLLSEPDPAAPGTAAPGAGGGDGAPLRLALAARRTSPSPDTRGLGAPTGAWSVEDGTLLVEGWDAHPGVFAVRRPDGRPAGWVATVGDDWGAFIDGRMVIDATDGEPWLSQDALYAVSLLRMALDQHLA